MPPTDIGRVARWIIFVQDHVRQQCGPTVAAFQQVVAENRVLREVSAPMIERIDIVNSLADKRTFSKQVLIHVRDNPRIRINTRIAAEQSHEPRSIRTRETDADSRLQNCVAMNHSLSSRIQHRPIQRMGHRRDHFASGISRKLGVCVQRDDVPHLQENYDVTDNAGESSGRSAQSRIQIGQLPALTFVAHPEFFLSVPSTTAVQQEEDIRSIVLVLSSQLGDAITCLLNQVPVAGKDLFGCIFEIRQQSKVQVLLTVGEIPNLQAFQQSLNRCGVGQHCRNDHQRPMRSRNARAKIHARQCLRVHHGCHHPVHDSDRQLYGGHHDRNRHQPQQQCPRPLSRAAAPQHGDDGSREQQRGHRIDEQREASTKLLDRNSGGHLHVNQAFKCRSTVIQQKVTDMVRALIRLYRHFGLRQLNGSLSHIVFRAA